MEIQIIAGFSGAGKTTFINQYIPLLSGKTVIVQNESGEEKLKAKTDGRVFMEQINSGCICCTLAMTFRQIIKEAEEKYHPDTVLIELAGTGYLSEVVKACIRAKEACQNTLIVTKLITIIDLSCLEECLDGLGSVFQEQIQNANLLLVSHMDEVSEAERERLFGILREQNAHALISKKDFKKLALPELKQLLEETNDYQTCEEMFSYMQNKKRAQKEKQEKKMLYFAGNKKK